MQRQRDGLTRAVAGGAWIARSLLPDLPVTFTSDWNGPFDGHELSRADLEVIGYKLFPWQIESDNA